MPTPNATSPNWPHQQQEGSARFQVGDAFFRASSRTGRDLAVLAAIAYKTLLPNQPFRILDAMTGCGVRPLRYALEANADYIWANEGNADLEPLLRANLSSSLSPDRYRITHQNANAVFFDCYQRQDFYDLVDVDGFGSPMPAIANALWAVKLGGLLYLASTDGRATSGHAPDRSLQTYGAYARTHPAAHEQGLRLLIGLVVQQAAARGLTAKPVFSFYKGEVNRVMVRVSKPANDWESADYGFLAYCHHCGQFQSVPWKKLSRVLCTCGSASQVASQIEEQIDKPIVSGPMWLGPLHDTDELEKMRQIAIRLKQTESEIASSSNHWPSCRSLIEILQAEANLPPYHYPLAEIGRRGKMDIPPRQALLSQLQQAGFSATPTHISSQAIKTNAPIADCVRIAQQVAQLQHSPE